MWHDSMVDIEILNTVHLVFKTLLFFNFILAVNYLSTCLKLYVYCFPFCLVKRSTDKNTKYNYASTAACESNLFLRLSHQIENPEVTHV